VLAAKAHNISITRHHYHLDKDTPTAWQKNQTIGHS
jgi:hypothetical protein